MEADQFQKLLQKCLSGGDQENWQKLTEELEREENAVLRQEWKRFTLLTPEDMLVDEGKMWAKVSRCQSEGKNRIKWGRQLLRYAAIIAIPLMTGVLGWALYQAREWDSPEKTVVSAMITPGSPRAILKLEGGKQIDLSVLSRDTLLSHRGTSIQLNSDHSLLYPEQKNNRQEIIYNTIMVPRAGEYRLTLADGTRVWLNADSELKYPVDFPSGPRRVFLRGEAYFEVAKNEKQPFLVEVGNMEVEVLGTKFNINASRIDGSYQTTLVEGKVRVSNHRTTESLVLRPDQQAQSKDGHFCVKEVDARVYTAWREGKFYFESEPLEEIAAQLERWYDVQFFFTRESLRKDEFTGVIRKDYTADRILDIITKTTNVKFEIRGRTISVF